MTNNFGKYFMVGIPGLVLDSSTEDLVRTQGIHNFIIFSRNVESPDQLRKLCQDLNAACQDYGLPLPFISIDQEGGTVARLLEPFTQFKDARVLAESGEPEKELAAFARTCAKDLINVGINMNLAPVLDICPSGKGFFMEHRSLGNDPYKVGELGCLVIDEMQKLGVAACGKHFPGLGAAKLDPHLQLPTVSKKHEEIVGGDLIPFQQAMAAGVAAIMTSHTIYSDIDDGIPATLSPFILSTMAREQLGYDGLIITDDLEMGAIENEGSIHEAAVKSFVAGADILLICHDHDKIRRSFTAFEEAVDEGVISADRLQDSSRRIDSAHKLFILIV
jgi:beta-N-acetylhexosaminidase